MSKIEINKTYRISVPHDGFEEVDEYYNSEEKKVYLVTTAYKGAEIHVTPETQTELELLNQYISKDTPQINTRSFNISGNIFVSKYLYF